MSLKRDEASSVLKTFLLTHFPDEVTRIMQKKKLWEKTTQQATYLTLNNAQFNKTNCMNICEIC